MKAAGHLGRNWKGKNYYNLEASDEVLESDFSSDMSGRSFCTDHYERFECAF